MSFSAEKAKLLLAAARSLAISSYGDIPEVFSKAGSVGRRRSLSDWDFFMTVAGVGSAFVMIPRTISKAEQEGVLQLLLDEMRAWDHQGCEALEDFVQFIREGVDGGVELPSAIGMWVFWNLKQDRPTYEEAQEAVAIGRFLMYAFLDWWSEGS